MRTSVYRNISRPILIFGLEITDFFILGILFLVIFNVSNHILINAALMGSAMGVMRYFKKDKPSGYFLHLVQFIRRPKQWGVHLETRKEKI